MIISPLRIGILTWIIGVSILLMGITIHNKTAIVLSGYVVIFGFLGMLIAMLLMSLKETSK